MSELIRCEICDEIIGRVEPTKLLMPIRGDMFTAQGEGYPPPFPEEFGFVDMRCPFCHFRPFTEDGWIMLANRGRLLVPEAKEIEAIDLDATVADEVFRLQCEPTGDPEAQLLRLADEGKTPTEIGEIIGKSPQWVGIHTKRLMG